MLKCDFCDRKGLLIYPVRYAVACPAGASGVPALSGNFKIEGAPQDIGTAKYTLRAVRAGYLYTYDEKRKRLKAYMVTASGYLWNFPIEHLPPKPEMVPFSCVDTGEVVRAKCVDIVHSPGDLATNLWIGWTSVVWTPALIKNAEDPNWRKTHMQCVNVPAMLEEKAAHAAEFKANYSKVAHFGINSDAMRKAFAYSNTPTIAEARQHKLGPKMADIMGTQEPHKKGFIVAVNDPVGITNDLSELTLPGLDSGFDEKMYQAKMVADLLEGTEQSVRTKARNSIIDDDRTADAYTAEGTAYSDMFTALFTKGGSRRVEEKHKREEELRQQKLPGRQKEAEDKAWEELTTENGKALLDENQWKKTFPAQYDAAIEVFKPTLDKLIKAHVDWLKSDQLGKWMDGVHDKNDICSGYAYSESVAQCIGKGVSTDLCKDQLLFWLNSPKLSDIRNLYSRGLLFNQNDIIAATEPHLKGSDFQFENVLNLYKRALERLDPKYTLKLIDRLALATGNVVIRAINRSTYTVARQLALVHLSMLGGVTIKASNMSASDLAKWAIEQAKTQHIDLDTNRTQTRADAYKEAKSNVKKLPTDDKLLAYELDIAKLEQEGRIASGSIKSIKLPGIDATQKWLGSSAPREFHLGVVTALIQLVALGFATQDWANNDQFNATETRTKAALAVVSLGATIVDTVGSTVEKSATHPLAVFLRQQWAVDVENAAKYAKAARCIGAAAGMALGLFDILKNAPDAFSDGNKTLGWLYRLNGVLGVGIALVAWLAIGSLFWPLLILSVIVGIVIALVSSGLLKTWISRCHFGKSEHYHDFDAELKAYNHAVGA
ncbi:T6SS effector BTH_I2691 family protein [Collimonas sp.]|jgi:hypothetical protein|uniref:T6SS effector BTH_I2691 family protein n=1 Tax=Collimonas sp. TaxID=1963772 RepID=UPI002B7C110A|nr:T6SS effector BTH_I2691 family protein [Collimonas sp.]HWW04307.1 T6SS effector BTH_I2691 family protein [Collimonas sp.]